MEWSEDDILDRLKSWAEDEHRNYIYPEQAQALLRELKKRDDTIGLLTHRVSKKD